MPPINQLLIIAQALDPLGFKLGPAQRRQKHGRQYRDNRNDDKQFDERERMVALEPNR